MPTYEYRCTDCGYEMEEFQSISAPSLVRCPSCAADSLVRILGGGAGLIFRGTGFYLTDYKKEAGAGAGAKKSNAQAGEKKNADAGTPPAPPPKKEDSH